MLLENFPYPDDPRVSREARALVAAGHEVTVIAPRAPASRGVRSSRASGCGGSGFPPRDPRRRGSYGVPGCGLCAAFRGHWPARPWRDRSASAQSADLLFPAVSWRGPLGGGWSSTITTSSPNWWKSRSDGSGGEGGSSCRAGHLRGVHAGTAGNESHARVARERGKLPPSASQSCVTDRRDSIVDAVTLRPASSRTPSLSTSECWPRRMVSSRLRSYSHPSSGSRAAGGSADGGRRWRGARCARVSIGRGGVRGLARVTGWVPRDGPGAPCGG